MMSPFFGKHVGAFPKALTNIFRPAANNQVACSPPCGRSLSRLLKTDGNRFPLWSGSPYAAKTDIGKAMNGTQYVISLQPENGPRSQKPERKVG